MTYVTRYVHSIGKITIEMSYEATYAYHNMFFEVLIKLNYHLIQHVTLIYSPTITPQNELR